MVTKRLEDLRESLESRAERTRKRAEGKRRSRARKKRKKRERIEEGKPESVRESAAVAKRRVEETTEAAKEVVEAEKERAAAVVGVEDDILNRASDAVAGSDFFEGGGDLAGTPDDIATEPIGVGGELDVSDPGLLETEDTSDEMDDLGI